ncbi:MAG: hypothetical protein KVP17_000846, partial [Porospora cf. gigantea B]
APEPADHAKETTKAVVEESIVTGEPATKVSPKPLTKPLIKKPVPKAPEPADHAKETTKAVVEESVLDVTEPAESAKVVKKIKLIRKKQVDTSGNDPQQKEFFKDFLKHRSSFNGTEDSVVDSVSTPTPQMPPAKEQTDVRARRVKSEAQYYETVLKDYNGLKLASRSSGSDVGQMFSASVESSTLKSRDLASSLVTHKSSDISASVAAKSEDQSSAGSKRKVKKKVKKLKGDSASTSLMSTQKKGSDATSTPKALQAKRKVKKVKSTRQTSSEGSRKVKKTSSDAQSTESKRKLRWHDEPTPTKKVKKIKKVKKSKSSQVGDKSADEGSKTGSSKTGSSETGSPAEETGIQAMFRGWF